MIKAENITKSFGKLQVLKGINLEVQAGEVVSIVGASGAGKTTLLQILGTLSKQDGGIVTINGIRTDKLLNNQLARFRNQHIGFVFQFHQLLPEFTALENVCIPGFIANRPRNEVEQKAKELLDFLGLTQRLEHKPGELSGGDPGGRAFREPRYGKQTGTPPIVHDPEGTFSENPGHRYA
jgi:lipoprotein-releasing system ATP-binding protein